jgi:hypothetical protein
MSTMPVPIIRNWSVDHDGGWLTIEVMFPAPVRRMTFVRCQWDTSGNPLSRHSTTDESKRRWVWAQMSERGKPTVRVDEAGWEVLDDAVKQHEVLTHINDHWRIT